MILLLCFHISKIRKTIIRQFRNVNYFILEVFKCLILTKAALQYAQKKQMQGIEEENSIRK